MVAVLAVPRSWRGAALVAVSLVLFSALATLNAGGYRYGASDQAFYIPAVQHHLDPSLFPRDWPMLAAQDRLNAFTPVAAFLASSTGTSLPVLFLALYLAGLSVLGAAGLLLAGRLFRSRWTAAALLAALTLRHAVALGAVNTLEGYMHPRTIAFALGAAAVGTFVRGGSPVVAVLVALAGIVHPTTAIWFAVWLAVAMAVAEPRWRLPLAGMAGAAALAAAWALSAGPLAGRLAPMDDAWIAALEAKRYLFPNRWPAWAWVNAGLVILVPVAVYRVRRSRALADSRETGLVAGALALAAMFLASVPFTAAGVAFVVQLQVPRVLWLLDLLAVVYLVWALAEGEPATRSDQPSRRPALVAALLVAAAVGRGAWVMGVEHPERRALEVGIVATDWNRTLEWVRTHTSRETHVLADPGHAWRYGTSVRVAASRDVCLEEAKDGAFALYSREAAGRLSRGFAPRRGSRVRGRAAEGPREPLRPGRPGDRAHAEPAAAARKRRLQDLLVEAAVVGGTGEGRRRNEGNGRLRTHRLPPTACRLPSTACRPPPAAPRLPPTPSAPRLHFGG